MSLSGIMPLSIFAERPSARRDFRVILFEATFQIRRGSDGLSTRELLKGQPSDRVEPIRGPDEETQIAEECPHHRGRARHEDTFPPRSSFATNRNPNPSPLPTGMNIAWASILTRQTMKREPGQAFDRSSDEKNGSMNNIFLCSGTVLGSGIDHVAGFWTYFEVVPVIWKNLLLLGVLDFGEV